MPALRRGLAECEKAADLARANLAATIDQLRTNLEPRNLMVEIARGSGLHDIRAANAFEFAVRRHTTPALLMALVLGFCAYSAVRWRTSSGSDNRRRSVGAAVATVRNSAAKVFRERVEARRQAVLAKANAHVAATAAQLSDVVENSVDNLVGGIIPENRVFRPLIESTVQIAMLSILDALLRPLAE